MNLEKRANIIQAEMDFKVTDHEARMLFLLASLVSLSKHLEQAANKDKDSMMFKLSHIVGESAATLYEEVERHSGKKGAIFDAAWKVAAQQMYLDMKESVEATDKESAVIVNEILGKLLKGRGKT